MCSHMTLSERFTVTKNFQSTNATTMQPGSSCRHEITKCVLQQGWTLQNIFWNAHADTNTDNNSSCACTVLCTSATAQVEVHRKHTLKVMQSASSMVCRTSMDMPCAPMVFWISVMMMVRAASMPRTFQVSMMSLVSVFRPCTPLVPNTFCKFVPSTNSWYLQHARKHVMPLNSAWHSKHSIAQHGMAQHGTAQHGTAQHVAAASMVHSAQYKGVQCYACRSHTQHVQT